MAAWPSIDDVAARAARIGAQVMGNSGAGADAAAQCGGRVRVYAVSGVEENFAYAARHELLARDAGPAAVVPVGLGRLRRRTVGPYPGTCQPCDTGDLACPGLRSTRRGAEGRERHGVCRASCTPSARQDGELRDPRVLRVCSHKPAGGRILMRTRRADGRDMGAVAVGIPDDLEAAMMSGLAITQIRRLVQSPATGTVSGLLGGAYDSSGKAARDVQGGKPGVHDHAAAQWHHHIARLTAAAT